VPELPDVNPNVAQLYRRKVKRPAEELAQDPSSQEPVIALRSLIGEVVLTHAEKRGVPSAHVGHAELADFSARDVGPSIGRFRLVRCSLKSRREGPAAPSQQTQERATPASPKPKWFPSPTSTAARSWLRSRVGICAISSTCAISRPRGGYTPERKGGHCRAHLPAFTGWLHAEGYAGFGKLYEIGGASSPPLPLAGPSRVAAAAS
jgi:hypothetical protein